LVVFTAVAIGGFNEGIEPAPESLIGSGRFFYEPIDTRLDIRGHSRDGIEHNDLRRQEPLVLVDQLFMFINDLIDRGLDPIEPGFVILVSVRFRHLSISAFEALQALVKFAAIMVDYIDQSVKLAADFVDPFLLLLQRILQPFKRILQKYLRTKKHLVFGPEYFVFADHRLHCSLDPVEPGFVLPMSVRFGHRYAATSRDVPS
jgi:hypothetical protein